MKITAVSRLKHTELKKAADKLGGQKALAEYVGVSQCAVGEWCNLNNCPPISPTAHWPAERIEQLATKLEGLTGVPYEDLFPPELRSNKAFLKHTKRYEKTAEIENAALADYATKTAERLSAPVDSQLLLEEKRSSINEALGCLSDRERAVVKERFGIDTEPKGLNVVADQFGVSPERIRQIESKAIRRLQQPGISSILVGYID